MTEESVCLWGRTAHWNGKQRKSRGDRGGRGKAAEEKEGESRALSSGGQKRRRPFYSSSDMETRAVLS